MKKMIFVTLIASVSYFIIYIFLKLSLKNAILDWQNALLGAIVFSFFIFLVHFFLRKIKYVS
jgi:hypothetical protein